MSRMSWRTREIALGIAAWAALVACAALFWRQVWLLAGIYLLASVVLLALGTRRDATIYVLGFLLGPGGEIVAVHFGVWQYANAAWLIPIWLPPAWGLAALILYRLTIAIGRSADRS